MPQFQRGAIPTPRHRLAQAMPFVPMVAAPSSYGVVPTNLQMWGNDQYGDCVSAQEAFSKLAFSVQRGATPLYVPDDVLIAWARKHGYRDGALLPDVMDTMIKEGIDVDGKNYKDGPYAAVDWTNFQVLSAALYQGPVNIAVAANQLGSSGAGNENGWEGKGWHRDKQTDHCVALCGYGTGQELATLLGTSLKKISPSTPCVFLYTWKSIGIVEFSSMVNITDEAWLRSPTTVPDPGPAPTPTPTPTPTPAPTTGGIIIDFGSRTISAPGFSLVPSI